jgi:glutaminyl-tRNA synthetase
MPHASGAASPAQPRSRKSAPATRRRYPHPLPAGAQRLPALRPCQVDLPEFRPGRDYAGACHLRFDDTNPEKEEQEYVDSIIDVVRWLGFDWKENLYFASDYFQWMYDFAEKADRSRPRLRRFADRRGDARQPRHADRSRHRTPLIASARPAENLDLFRRMKAGEFADGAHVLRAKIDMASGNINLRDPAIYRIRHATHHNTGDAWCIYPMYTYAHPIEDALENITHSICTLEFEDQRPFYDWLLAHLAELGCVNSPCRSRSNSPA